VGLLVTLHSKDRPPGGDRRVPISGETLREGPLATAARSSLAAVRRFPRVLYLAPEPAAPFVAMTEACARRWPEHPPYAGAFADVIPHLTLAEGPEPPGLAERAASMLPLRARAETAWLMTPRPGGGWKRRALIPLG